MMIKKTFSFILVLPFLICLIFLSSCNKKESPLPLELQKELDEQEVLISIDIPATLKDGALLFKDHIDFHQALRMLDTVNLISRKAWENKIGFQSIRMVYEEVLSMYNDGLTINYDDYSDIIDFSGFVPVLKANDEYSASVLNRENYVYVSEFIGTIRLNGCYWIMSGDKNQLEELLISKRPDFENGILVYENNLGDESNIYRSCTNYPPDESWSESATISNGNSAGSSNLAGSFRFQIMVTPNGGGGPSSAVDYLVFVKMTGRSKRRNRRGKWKNKKADHTFSWDFKIKKFNGALNPHTFTFYSGQETHYNNQYAVKYIEIFHNLVANSSWPVINGYNLEEVYSSPFNGSGTFQTTNYLTPSKIEYDCN